MNALMMTLQQPISVAALAQCLGWSTRHPAVPALSHWRRRRDLSRQRAMQAQALSPPSCDDDPAVPGCGWFDSSHELQQGLEVLEHAGAEGLGNDLPVTAWLGLVLDRVPAPVASDKPDAVALKA